MKTEYDFKNAERGKFFRKNASLKLPVYLEAGVRDYVTERAEAKGIPVSDLLKRGIELIEAAN